MWLVIASKDFKDVVMASYTEKRKAEDFKACIDGVMTKIVGYIVWIKEVKE